jgi:hypothetical protein
MTVERVHGQHWNDDVWKSRQDHDYYMYLHNARQEHLQDEHMRAMEDLDRRMAASKQRREQFRAEMAQPRQTADQYPAAAPAQFPIGGPTPPRSQGEMRQLHEASYADLVRDHVKAFGGAITPRMQQAVKYGGNGVVPPVPFEIWHQLTQQGG